MAVLRQQVTSYPSLLPLATEFVYFEFSVQHRHSFPVSMTIERRTTVVLFALFEFRLQ